MTLFEFFTRLEARLSIMRLIFPPSFAFSVWGEFRKLHAVNTNGDSSEFLGHVGDQFLFAALFNDGLGQSGSIFVLLTKVTHLSSFDTRLSVNVRFKISFILFKFGKHCHFSVLSECGCWAKFRVINECDGFPIVYYFIFRILNNNGKASLLTSCLTVIFISLLDTGASWLLNQPFTADVMLFLANSFVVSCCGFWLFSYIFFVWCSSLALHIRLIYSVRYYWWKRMGRVRWSNG